MASESPVGMEAERELLQGAVDKIPAMLAYWDAAQRCRFANRAYEQWFGVSPEALLGTHIRDLLGPIYALNRPHIEAALRGEPQEFEREIPDPSGGPSRHSLANYIPDIIDGVVRGFFVLVTEVSAMKRAELALKESEAKFSGIIAIAADAIISVDEDQRITIFNAGAEKIFGYAAPDAIGRDLGMLLPARFRDAHRGHIAAFLATNGDASRQMGERTAIVALRKSGDEFPAEAAISKLELGGRKLLTVALRDVTERRRVEMEHAVLAEAGAVLSSSLNYAQTLKSIAELVVRHIADLCVVDMIEEDAKVNKLTVAHADPTKLAACEALTRLSLDSKHTLASSAIDTKQPQLFDDLSPPFLEAMAQDAKHLWALREIAPRSAIVVPMLSAGTVLGAIVFASSRPHRYTPRDVGFVTELAHRAALAIENARLYQAAQRASQARDDILGVVAHDVRSPLNAIFLAAQLLERRLEKTGDVGGQDHTATIVRSVRRANRLIEDLLEVTQLEAGALGLSCKTLAARPVLIDVLGAQQLSASAASIELRLDIPDELPEIWADRDRLLQVLENLVGNALKFTPKGGWITIAAVARPDEVLFSVADTGTGIPEHGLLHVFDRFWQAKRSERRGAGLGLAICRGIVEGHGGRIWVESTVERGSTFFFTVPTAAGIQKVNRQASARLA